MIKQIWKPLVFVLVIGGLATALYVQVSSLKRPPVGIGIGELAPDFTASTLEGETIRLSDFRGKTVLVNDFSTRCGPCQAKTSSLEDVYNAEGDNVVFVGSNQQESGSKVTEFKDQYNIPYTLALVPDSKVTRLHRLVGLPTSWFIDSEGAVRYVHAGPMTAAMLEETLDAIREGREPNINSALN